MTDADVLLVFHEALGVLAATAAPLIAVVLVTGLSVAIAQTLTQVQEATLTFVPKIVASVAVLIIAGPFMGAKFASFAREMYRMIEVGFDR